MKNRLISAGLLVVTGFSPLAAQEKEGTIPEVTIAAKMKQPLYKTGKNIQLLTAEDLEKFKGQSLSEILQQVSGIQITGNYNNAPEPKIIKARGGKMANLLILLDGIPLKDVTANDYTAADIRLIAAENIESIELLNGASSVLYGSNATVSVINIKTRKNAAKVLEGNLTARGGSFGTFAQNISLRGKKDQWNYQLTGFNEKSDGISAAEGINFDRDGFNKQNLSARAGWTKNRLSLQMNAGLQNHVYDYDAGAFEDGAYRGKDRQFLGGLTAQYQYGKNSLTLNSRFTSNRRLSQQWIGPAYQDQFSFSGRNLFAELYQTTRFSEYISLVAGVQYEHQALGAEALPWGGSAMLPVLSLQETQITTLDAFVNTNLQYGRLRLDAGARLNNHSKYQNHLVYSINPYYLAEIGNTFIKAGYSYATAFIAPTLYQNYGAAPFVLPNFSLKPETNASHELDFSIGKTDRSFVFSASLFRRDERDVFVYSITDFVNYAGKFQNVAENTVKGMELSFNYQLNKALQFGGNFSYAERDNHEATLRLPRSRAGAFADLAFFKDNRINFAYQFVAERRDAFYDSASGTVKNVTLKPFHLFSANLSQKISKDLQAYFNIGNLFNTPYTDIIGFRSRPRNYMLGLEYRF